MPLPSIEVIVTIAKVASKADATVRTLDSVRERQQFIRQCRLDTLPVHIVRKRQFRCWDLMREAAWSVVWIRMPGRYPVVVRNLSTCINEWIQRTNCSD